MSGIKVIETTDGELLLGALVPTDEPGVLSVRTGKQGQPRLIHVDDIESITDASDDDRVHTL